MALQKGSIIASSTKTKKGKEKKVKDIEIDIDIVDKGESVSINIEFNQMIEPYVRHRIAGDFITPKGSDGKKKKSNIPPRLYDPLNVYKKRIQRKIETIMEEKYPDFVPCEGEATFEVIVYRKALESFSKKQKLYAIVKKLLKPLNKPDLDNIVKTGMDLFPGLFWKDDTQVTRLVATKFYDVSEKTIIKIDIEKQAISIKGNLTGEEKEEWEQSNLT
jgi:Holliday junction resolvase RusA-like endonuclease